MIKIFRTNILVTFFVTALLALFFSSFSFLNEPEPAQYFLSWYSTFFDWVNNNDFLNFSFTVIIIISTSLILNTAFNKTSFYQKTTALPAIWYIILLAVTQNLAFKPILFIDIILTLFLLKIVELDQNKSAVHTGFITGLVIGLSFLVSFWLIPVGLIVFLSISIFRPFVWREWMVSLVGLFLPLIYLFSFQFVVSGGFAVGQLTPGKLNPGTGVLDILAYCLTGLVLLLGSAGLVKLYRTATIVQRKQLNVLVQLLLIAVLMFGVLYFHSGTFLFLFNIPLAVLLSVYLLNIKQERIMNILIAGLIVVNLLRIFID